MTHTSERSSRAVQGMAAAIAEPMFRPLGAYFVDAGLISPAQVQVVLNDQEMTGLRFGEILVQRGWIKEKTVEYFVDKLIEPERRSLQKSLAWQKGTPNKNSAHRKGFVTGPPAAPQTNRKTGQVATSASGRASTLRPAASQHRKGFVSPKQGSGAVVPSSGMENGAASAAANAKEITHATDEITTISGLSRDSDYDEVAESLVWVG